MKMTINEAKIRLDEEMKYADSLLSDIDGIKYYARVDETTRDDDGEVRTVFLFGAIMLATPEMEDEDRVYLSLDAEIDINDNIDTATFEADAAKLRARLEKIRERLLSAEDKAAEIAAIGKDIDREIDEEYRAEIERLNASTKHNLKVAMMGAALLLVVAAVCILVKILF